MENKHFKTVAVLCAAALAALVGPMLIARVFDAMGVGGTVFDEHSVMQSYPDDYEDSGVVVSVPETADDDGELHDGWDDSYGYHIEDQSYEVQETALVDTYGVRVALDIHVSYPEFVDAGEHTDALNAELREVAMAMADALYLHPSDEMVSIVRGTAGWGSSDLPRGADTVISDEVSYAVTYNTADFVSVSFSDVFEVGAGTGSFIVLRCVNFDLRTGESYDVDDVLRIDEEVAEAFVDTLQAYTGEDVDHDGMISEPESFTVAAIGRDAWVSALLGEGDYAHRMVPTFFVDEQGRPNLAVTWWMSVDGGYSRGWWDTTLDAGLLDGAQVEGDFWELLQQ